MINDKKLIHLYSEGSINQSINYYLFKCRLFKYFYTYMAYYEKLPRRFLRETLDFIRCKYKVIYMEVNGKLAGYGTIVRGGGARYTFSSGQDAVICNVWIEPEFRGKGLSNHLVSFLLNYAKKYVLGDIYSYIHKDNLASQAIFTKLGFTKISTATRVSKIHKIVKSEKGKLGIYVYTKST